MFQPQFNTARAKGGTYSFVVKSTYGFKALGKGKRDASTVEELFKKIQETDGKIRSVSLRDWPPPRSWRETGEINPREYIGEPEPGVIVTLDKGGSDGWLVDDWTSMQDAVNLVRSLQRGNKIKTVERQGRRITVTTG